MELRAGEVTALVGSNGCGKTTLVKLLCRLYDPDQGRVTIDGIDLRETDPTELHRGLSVIFQDFTRYQLTARQNIWVGDVSLPDDGAGPGAARGEAPGLRAAAGAEQPDAASVSTQTAGAAGLSAAASVSAQAAIEGAARLAGADQVIAGLPDGYQTMLGRWFQGGEELSIGEWQKVALARAFLRGAGILVLDEPTSSLDPLAERQVFDRLREVAADRVVLVISHRFSTVYGADRIHIMDAGRIIESGSHEELVARDGVYAAMWRAQGAPSPAGATAPAH
ncbi:MAG: ATP-binding cassette domain-containing protein [Actinobacteria bacterium]|nr:ATP-binding cassette domain-containing protein [Actinomycetota bacterium]